MKEHRVRQRLLRQIKREGPFISDNRILSGIEHKVRRSTYKFEVAKRVKWEANCVRT